MSAALTRARATLAGALQARGLPARACRIEELSGYHLGATGIVRLRTMWRELTCAIGELGAVVGWIGGVLAGAHSFDDDPLPVPECDAPRRNRRSRWTQAASALAWRHERRRLVGIHPQSWGVLGLEPGAPWDAIEAAYRARVGGHDARRVERAFDHLASIYEGPKQ